MESITIKPRTKKEFNFFKELFEKTNTPIEYRKEKTKTLEEKIFRLYQQGHYTDSEIKMFFDIPKQYRVDPFDMIDDGDIYWADQRNIDQTIKDAKQARKDIEDGKGISLKTREELYAYFESL